MATYPVMLAVLSSSCNEETRAYSERDEGVQRGVSMANQFREAVIPRLTEVVGRGELSGGTCPTRNRRGTCPEGLLSGGPCPGGRCPTLPPTRHLIDRPNH